MPENALKQPRRLYAMGKKYLGLSRAENCYPSQSYWDKLAWGAFWLYQAEKDQAYLTDIENFLSQPGKRPIP